MAVAVDVAHALQPRRPLLLQSALLHQGRDVLLVGGDGHIRVSHPEEEVCTQDAIEDVHDEII